MLFINREPWLLELHRQSSAGQPLQLSERVEVGSDGVICIAALPLTMRLTNGQPRPRIQVSLNMGVSETGRRQWLI